MDLMTNETTTSQELVHCEDCGRALRTERARAERVGPVCQRKRQAARTPGVSVAGESSPVALTLI